MSRPRLTALLAATAAAVLLSGCAGTTGTAAGSPSADPSASYPRTVQVDGHDVVLTARPTRIVPMSWEVSDLALELAGPARMAAVSDGSLSAASGNHVDLAKQVSTVLPYTTTPDPERVLSLKPDLVLMVARHGGEQAVETTMESSGVPVAVFSDADFETPDALVASIRTLGRLLGDEDAANKAADSLATQFSTDEAAVAHVTDKPRVLVLMARGQSVMEEGPDVMLNVLAGLAGGTSIATEQGLKQTVPIDAEGVLAANPDVILVEDFQGAGLAPFQSLLSSSAVASVPAVANHRIYPVATTIASATSTTRTGEGLSTVIGLLHPEVHL